MAQCPKYNFGLLETPDSSDLSNFADTTLLSMLTDNMKQNQTPEQSLYDITYLFLL